MSDKNTGKKAGGGADVNICVACPKKVSKANFCEEHFVWFKEGLINRKGEKPSDFDKKFQAFARKKPAA
jgi:hypothetical protein